MGKSRSHKREHNPKTIGKKTRFICRSPLDQWFDAHIFLHLFPLELYFPASLEKRIERLSSPESKPTSFVWSQRRGSGNLREEIVISTPFLTDLTTPYFFQLDGPYPFPDKSILVRVDRSFALHATIDLLRPDKLLPTSPFLLFDNLIFFPKLTTLYPFAALTEF